MASTHGARCTRCWSRPTAARSRTRCGEDGSLDAKRGGGGLVSGLSAIGPDAGALWVCAALSDGDREAVRRGVGEDGVRMLDIPADVHADAYNGIANSVLWFVHHMLYQTPLEPVFDAEFRRQWASYETYNRAFAEALAEEAGEGAAVLVQDYHLTLVPGMLRELRPDLRIGHFSHTPWAPVGLLPDAARRHRRSSCCAGMLGADRLGVPHPALGGRLHGLLCGVRRAGSADTRIGVHGLGADADFLRERAHQARRGRADGGAAGGDRRRAAGRSCGWTAPSCRRTSCAACWPTGSCWTTAPSGASGSCTWPSRTPRGRTWRCTATTRPRCSGWRTRSTPAYGTPGWTPVVLHVKDDFARSLAAYRLADVALVNPIRDGMNLVAKEVPVVSDEGCALVLSREAGAYEELGEDAIVVNPYDVAATAAALHEALTMPADERAERSEAAGRGGDGAAAGAVVPGPAATR